MKDGKASWLIPVTLAWLLLAGFLLLITARVEAQVVLGHHCGDVGPLPIDDWCGCTWGGVYHRGQPVAGARVEMEFAGTLASDVTAPRVMESYPYYRLRGDLIGARVGDVVTITAYYGSSSTARAVRLIPGADWDQDVNLVLTDDEYLAHWGETGMIRALLVDGDRVWLGTDEGLKRCPAAGGVCQVQPVAAPPAQVRALARGDDGHIWAAAGDPGGGVYEFDGAIWTTHQPGLPTDNFHALAIDPATGAVWAGTSGATAGLARFERPAWSVVPGFAHSVEALLAGGDGRLWVGTEADGLAAYDGATWTWHTTADGLASNKVYSLARELGALWAGTWAYLSDGHEYGGVSRLDLSLLTWQTFTTSHGLPDTSVPAVAIDGQGRKWFGTYSGGLACLDDMAQPAAWTTYTPADGLSADYVRSLAAGGDGRIWAGTAAGVDRVLSGIQGAPPTVLITALSPAVALGDAEISFAGEGLDADEDGSLVLGYDWQSSLDGPLSTFSTFTRTASLLTPGEHLISLRVQDDEGVWSLAAESTMQVRQAWRLFLPLLLKTL